MMTIKERVLARSDLQQAYDDRNLDALTTGLNAQPLYALTECWVDGPGILNRCEHGKAIMRKLKAGATADAVIELAWTSLASGKGLDFGAESTLSSIDEMAAVLQFTEEEANEIKSLGLQPVLVNRQQVEDALFNPDGSKK